MLILGLLRNPAGASSLATKAVMTTTPCQACTLNPYSADASCNHNHQ